MQIETIGKYRLHLFAYELPSGSWDPFVTILRFDDEIQDFKVLLDRHHVSETAFPTYEDAIEEARRVGTAMLETGEVK